MYHHWTRELKIEIRRRQIDDRSHYVAIYEFQDTGRIRSFYFNRNNEEVDRKYFSKYWEAELHAEKWVEEN